MKKFYESKTFWFNVLFGVVSIASLFGFGEFTPSESAIEIVAILGAAVNLVLRLFFTSEPIG